MMKPNFDDLAQCLTTLTRVADDGCVPASHADLHYHAIDLAGELDDECALVAAVEAREFETALALARDRSSR